MGQHEQLGLSVGSRADRRARQPGIADLTSIRIGTTMPCVAGWPCPSLDVKEPCRADHGTVVHPHSRERYCGARVPPGQGGVNVAGGFGLALRNRTPPVKRRIDRRGGYQPIDMAVLKWFQTNVVAC